MNDTINFLINELVFDMIDTCLLHKQYICLILVMLFFAGNKLISKGDTLNI